MAPIADMLDALTRWRAQTDHRTYRLLHEPSYGTTRAECLLRDDTTSPGLTVYTVVTGAGDEMDRAITLALARWAAGDYDDPPTEPQ